MLIFNSIAITYFPVISKVQDNIMPLTFNRNYFVGQLEGGLCVCQCCACKLKDRHKKKWTKKVDLHIPVLVTEIVFKPLPFIILSFYSPFSLLSTCPYVWYNPFSTSPTDRWRSLGLWSLVLCSGPLPQETQLRTHHEASTRGSDKSPRK